jgi:hypothetical protein
MNPSGGSLTIPACGAFSGNLEYPSFSGNAGTISASLVSSLQNNIGAGIPVQNSGAFFYIAITFSSSNQADTAITFGSELAGAPASCGQIDGTFTNGVIYYAEAEYPVTGGVATSSDHNAAGPGTFQAAGCNFDGNTADIGAQNFFLISTSQS